MRELLTQFTDMSPLGPINADGFGNGGCRGRQSDFIATLEGALLLLNKGQPLGE